jgi:hypothetical protein
MLRFRADGDLSSMDARVFFDVVEELLTTARAIDVAESGETEASIWRLAELSSGSANVGTRPERGAELEATVLRELDLVTSNAVADSLIPISRLRALIKVHARAQSAGLGQVSVFRETGRSVTFDEHAVKAMELRLASMVESIGSVTGIVETLRVPNDGQWYLSVRDRKTGRSVRCYLPRDESLLESARAAVHRPARIRGRTARHGLRGRIQEIRQVRSVEALKTDGDITLGFGHGPGGNGDRAIREQRG